MRVAKVIRDGAIVWLMSFVAAMAAFGVWFAWKWGAHYAGVWWRGVRERLEAGDTTINQASWWMRDRWETLGGVLDGPKINADSGPEILGVIGVGSVLLLLLRIPGVVLAGWLGRRAIRRDGILCDSAVARSLGRRVFVRGAGRWVVPAGLACGAALALVNHLWQFGEYMQSRGARMTATACTPLVFLVIDTFCSLRWARHVIAKDIRGRQRMCRWCGYDVTSMRNDICAECGKRVDTKSRDVGVRVVLRPRGARVVAVTGALVLVISGGTGWAVANAKGVSVLNEGRRLMDTVMMKKGGDEMLVFVPFRRVMVLQDETDTVFLYLVGPTPAEPATVSLRTLLAEQEGFDQWEWTGRVGGVGIEVGEMEIGFEAIHDNGVLVSVWRSVHLARLSDPDLSQRDNVWLVEGK